MADGAKEDTGGQNDLPVVTVTAPHDPTAVQPVPAPTPIESLEVRLHNLEQAFHASLSHLGASHPTVLTWVESIKARIAAILAGGVTPKT